MDRDKEKRVSIRGQRWRAATRTGDAGAATSVLICGHSWIINSALDTSCVNRRLRLNVFLIRAVIAAELESLEIKNSRGKSTMGLN